MIQYLKQYKVKDMIQMFRNEKKDPLVWPERCDGMSVAITGATAGIGKEAALAYARMGARLLLINRNKEKSEALCKELKEQFTIEADYKIADFTNLNQVKTVTQEILDSEVLPDIFIHNAGIFHTKYEETSDGIESVFQVNHLASFVMVDMMKEAYRTRGKGRLIYVNSEGHRFALAGVHLDDLKWDKHRFTGLASYGAAKTAQLLSMLAFDDYFRNSGVTIIAMHPGNVATQIGDDNDEKYLNYKRKKITPHARPANIAGTALYYLGLSPEEADRSGIFYSLTTEELPAPHAIDRDRVPAVMETSRRLAGL
ncbi:MAG: SDR family NAD(P)-dependent oxidoreductase [Spirochaetales bacterium]|nr:SDR family NAD(P)-dependent oxidoreductase [Spirochaetales bacterium]